MKKLLNGTKRKMVFAIKVLSSILISAGIAALGMGFYVKTLEVRTKLNSVIALVIFVCMFFMSYGYIRQFTEWITQ